MSGLSPLAVEFSGTNGDVVDFGVQHHVYSDTTPETITVSLWINPSVIEGGYLVTFSSGGGSLFFSIGESEGIPGLARLRVFNNIFKNAGGWNADNLDIPVDAWSHVLFTYDMSSDANDPLIYWDGISQTVAEFDTPVDTGRHPKNSGHVLIGNLRFTGQELIFPFTGKIFDVRVYDRVLTQTEITILYNDGTPSMMAGLTWNSPRWERNAGAENLYDTSLRFQAFTQRTEDLSNYVDVSLNSGLKLFEAQYKMVGVPLGTVTGRAAP